MLSQQKVLHWEGFVGKLTTYVLEDKTVKVELTDQEV